MKLPWVSRCSHEAILAPLSAQVGEMKQERKLLLDRLFSLGLGGPLFGAQETTPADEPEEEEMIDEIAGLRALRGRPTKLADALTRKSYRDFSRQRDKRTAWIPDMAKVAAVSSALDQAELQGKEQAR